MRQVDTNALLEVASALGVGNPATLVGQVSFDDETLQQALVVNDLIRRARNGFPPSGIATLLLAAAPAIAGTETTSLNPYEINGVAPWPATQHERDALDIWVTGVNVLSTGATGVLTGGRFIIGGIPGGNGAAPGSHVIAVYGSGEFNTGAQVYVLEGGTNMVTPRFLPVRVPRVATLTFQVTVTAAAAYQCFVNVALFPRGLGQDAVGAG